MYTPDSPSPASHELRQGDAGRGRAAQLPAPASALVAPSTRSRRSRRGAVRRGSLHSSFRQRRAAERISTITEEEGPGVWVTAAATSAFLQQHDGVKQQVCCRLLSCTLLVR